MQITPTADRVLVEPDEPDKKTRGGLILPDIAVKIPGEGTVLAIGPGKLDLETGERLPMTVKVGDRVAYSRYSGNEIEVDGKEFKILREDDILGVL
jgi:chaperonin GroES